MKSTYKNSQGRPVPAVVIAVVVFCIMTLLFNASGLHASLDKMPIATDRDAARRDKLRKLLAPVERLANTLQLTKPRAALESFERSMLE